MRPPRWFAVVLVVAVAGCAPPSFDTGGPNAKGSGPGRRQQRLSMSPRQELELGRSAYNQILRKERVLPADSRQTQRVRAVGEKIVDALRNKPLQRELNIDMDPRRYRYDWTFNTIQKREVNAFCLPGGFVAVYTGLLDIVENDAQLATVMSHEIAHALAHHASERMAQERTMGLALRAADDGMDDLSAAEQKQLMSSLSFGGSLGGLAHNRFQESEADHIGVFLMTFAGYDPRQAVAFWQSMAQASARRGGAPPEVLSDHPSDARRIAQLRAWSENARAAKRAFDEGRIDPRAR